MNYKTFKDFLISKYAETYRGVNDDMPDDFEKWLDGFEADELVEYADEYTAIQKEEIEKQNDTMIEGLLTANEGLQMQVKALLE